jgi:hypothetical protein
MPQLPATRAATCAAMSLPVLAPSNSIALDAA